MSRPSVQCPDRLSESPDRFGELTESRVKEGSHAVQGDSSAEAACERREVVWIARNHEVSSLQRTHDDRRIDDVGDTTAGARDACGAASALVEIFDAAAAQKT